jgi:hypothetical protein
MRCGHPWTIGCGERWLVSLGLPHCFIRCGCNHAGAESQKSLGKVISDDVVVVRDKNVLAA